MPPAELDFVAQKEIARLIAALRTAIRLSTVSFRQIERELEMSPGYLTRILAGEVQLRLSHVLTICQVIGFPADAFFAALYPPRPPTNENVARLVRGLAQLHPQPDPVPVVQDPDQLLQSLRAFLAEVKELCEKK